MSLSEKEEFSPSFKTYSECLTEPQSIEQLSQEIVNILNKQDKRSQVGEDSLSELRKTGQLLYDQLLSRAIKDRLKDKDSQDLILTVDEKLISIPWELLYTGENFLCLKFNLGRSIRTEKEINPQRYRELSYPLKMLIIANPTADLKSAYEEGLQIKNYLSKNRAINVDFKSYDVNTTYVKKNLRDYDIVHFAGHCEYDSANSSNSGWSLSDGLMRVKDFLLMAQSQSLPSVIFTNACQSAKSEVSFIDPKSQKYIFNLAYAFLFSGVRHYIGTSWRIDDALALEFAKELYSRIIQEKSIGEALRMARINLIKRHSIDTVAWASYILYGDPAFTLSCLKPSRLVLPQGKKKISKKKVLSLSLVALSIIIGLSLYRILPTINPSTQFLFCRVNQLFLKGENQKTVDTVENIIKKDALFLPAYKILGDIYFRMGDMSNALRYYSDYLRFSEKKKDNKNLGSAYLKIAWVYHMKGDYPRAEDFYNQAINLSRKNNDKLNEADGLGRLAVWNIDKGNYEKAFALLLQSCEINRQRQFIKEHKFNLACDYFNIAFLFVERNNYQTAKEFYRRSFDVFKELKAIPELSDYYFNMGEIALFEKRYQEALDYYDQGLAIDEKLSHYFNLSSDYQMIAELYLEMGRFEDAKKNFQEAILLCKRINNLPVLAAVYYDLGLMYKQKGEKDKAKDFLTQALEIYKDIDTPDYQKVHKEFLALE
jgi:CHAT domain-containing protein